MGYLDQSLEKIHQDLKEHKVTVTKLVEEAIEKATKLQKENSHYENGYTCAICNSIILYM